MNLIYYTLLEYSLEFLYTVGVFVKLKTNYIYTTIQHNCHETGKLAMQSIFQQTPD